jgi:hypothetical protein
VPVSCQQYWSFRSISRPKRVLETLLDAGELRRTSTIEVASVTAPKVHVKLDRRDRFDLAQTCGHGSCPLTVAHFRTVEGQSADALCERTITREEVSGSGRELYKAAMARESVGSLAANGPGSFTTVLRQAGIWRR